MSVVAKFPEIPPTGKRWNDGLCSCFDNMGICCQTCWCWHFTLSNITHSLETGKSNPDFCTCCFLSYSDMQSYCMATPAFAFGHRRQVIRRFNIIEGDNKPESYCTSCCLTMWCFPCSACQIQREMESRLHSAGGFCAPPRLEQAPYDAAHQQQLEFAKRHWGTELCDCNCKECCDGCCCYCCGFGKTATVLQNGEPGQLDIGMCLASYCLPTHVAYAQRRETVEMFHLDESSWKSMFYAFCCTMCSMCQVRRELGFGGQYPGGLCETALLLPPAAERIVSGGKKPGFIKKAM